MSDVKKKLTAAELIATKQAESVRALPPGLEKELLQLCAHNDTAGRNRVGRAQAIDLCRSYGLIVGHDGLDKLCRQLGRRSYASK